jgi:hypothetical protein
MKYRCLQRWEREIGAPLAAGILAGWWLVVLSGCASGRMATRVTAGAGLSETSVHRSFRRCVADDWVPPHALEGVRFSDRVPCALRTSVIEALETAVAALRREPECRALFDELGRDGLELLSVTRFVAADARAEVTICSHAVAFTMIGAQWTGVCRSFAHITNLDAATVLLHEALHHAGVGEWPHDRTADRSRQITAEVGRRCRLRSGR